MCWVQIMLICYAWFCALTRVSDYKHHPTDVLAGGLLGTLIALAFSSIIAVSRQDQDCRSKNITEEDCQRLKSGNDNAQL